MNIVLIEAPWGASLRPSLGLHALKAHLEGNGFGGNVEVVYSNIDFYEMLPESMDKPLLHSFFWSNPEISWLTEAFFAPEAYADKEMQLQLKRDFANRLTKLSEGSSSERLIPPPLVEWLGTELEGALNVLKNVVPEFLRQFTRDERLTTADVLGFGHHFNQLFGSLSMARWVKEIRPELPIVLGGASMTMPLAEVIQDSFEQIDHVFVGDAEADFEGFCRAIKVGNAPENGSVARFSASKSVNPASSVNYDAFFDRIDGTRFSSQLRSVPVELTRDCYWARISQCSFCGLPEQRNMKTANSDTVIAKVVDLYERQRVRHFIFADPAIHWKKHDRLIRGLADYFEGLDDQPVFFFEARVDTPKDTLETLARMQNVVVQVGIESFGHKILGLMKKGVDPIENVQFLKWSKELGIFPYYNLLWGHPGEPPKEYEKMTNLIPRISHLTPPSGYTPVLLCRDGPLFEAGCEDISEVKPWYEYEYLFPELDKNSIFKAAYYFDYNAVDANGDPVTSKPSFDDRVTAWQKQGEFGNIHLVHYRSNSALIVSDTRNLLVGKPGERVLQFTDQQDIAILEMLGEIRSRGEIQQKLGEHEIDMSVSALTSKLSEFEDAGLIMSDQDRYLFLALAI
ncbi:MAG: RiPP maturation radical SAM protein 1 [Hyphomicrobiales bacterium]|nr:RiPP maturation radical SAM protein 1 [Hyphomicrobiales bacterium]